MAVVRTTTMTSEYACMALVVQVVVRLWKPMLEAALSEG